MVSGVCLTALCLTREGVAQWTCLHELRREGVSTCLIPELVMGILLGGGGGGGGTPIIQLCNALQAIAGKRSTSACRDERGRQPVGMAQVPTGRSGKRRRAREGCFGFSSAVPVHNGSRKSRRPSGAALGRNGQLHSPSLAGPLPRFAAPHFVLFSACRLALARLELMMLGI